METFLTPAKPTWSQHWLTRLGVLTSHPAAFAAVFIFALAWLILDHETFEWHAVAVMATWLMTLMIQRAGHRDTQALHAKLDELLRQNPGARNELIHIDEQQPEQIEAHRIAEGVIDDSQDLETR